ncbi:MAG: hypothetical protein A2452_11410 [Candidatus Firestonebacteria bacterium RIFOXYC2_FULL_39_67]|nr:MAG: hypothetical protein A2536_09945 [Candidatus Firestonebacteria bacterium RIFOXYD2_FULL_39_29]OGF54553.1 MAG: hypothetical protein A2452_11410 [Candidatus Firestonebacteria bacterium RIFOXYC2_FULL_39_67]
MIKKTCTDIREKFSDYIDELLPEQEMADLEMHMKKCPACKKDLESFNKTVQVLKNLPRYTAHPNIIVRINNRIEKNKRWWQRFNPKVLKGTFGVITAVILCVFGLQLYNGTNVVDILRVKEAAKTSQENGAAKNEKTLKSEVQQKKRKSAAPKAQTATTERKAITAGTAETEREEKRKTETEEKKAEDKITVNKVQIAGEFTVGKTDAAEQLRQTSQPLEKELKLEYTAKASSSPVDRLSPLESAYEQKGLYCKNSVVENIVIKDEKSFEKLWAKCFSEMAKPFIDFKNEIIVVIFLGEQAESPKDIILQGIISEKDKIKVKYSLKSILNTDTSGKILSPYYIKAVKKLSIPVEFIKE